MILPISVVLEHFVSYTFLKIIEDPRELLLIRMVLINIYCIILNNGEIVNFCLTHFKIINAVQSTLAQNHKSHFVVKKILVSKTTQSQ